MINQSGILVIIAHPDDEIFVSGTICLCAEKGFNITLVCVTDGEGGSVDLLHDKRSPALAAVRRNELTLSAWVLGVSDVLFLGQADVANPDSEAAHSWDQPSLITALGRIVQERQPALILTHGPLGGYGHPAHRLVHKCVMVAAEDVSFPGCVFSFCGQISHAFFSWHFDQPSDVCIDVRRFLKIRAASLSYHQSQIDYFLQPYFPNNLKRLTSAVFGYLFIMFIVGRKRVPIGTSRRFFKKFPIEGLAWHRTQTSERPHFFDKEFNSDPRIKIN